MSEREFELYLSLLSRFLRLDPSQREQIADELRDHFLERFEELVAAGLSREEAIQVTINEFGDAAGLAAQFTHIGNRRRRIIMRCTVGTAAGLVAAIFLAAIFWPAPNPAGPAQAVAQQPAQPEAAQPQEVRQVSKSLDQATVEAKLGTRVPNLAFVDPLEDVLEFLSDAMEVDILVNPAALGEEGITVETPVTLQIKYSAVTVRTALELVIEPLKLGYTIRDGLVYITRNDANEIQIYNVRDLRKDYPGAMGGVGGPPGNVLIDLIVCTIQPDTWDEVGGWGSIAEFDGLLVIKQSQTVHREIARLLEMMREIDKRDVPAGSP